MRPTLKYIFLLLMLLPVSRLIAQVNTYGYPTQGGTNTFRPDTGRKTPARQLTGDQLLDSLRKKEDKKRDTVIFTSKFIKVTNEALLSDSTQVFKLDTGLNNFENYSPLYQPQHPYIGLGNLGLDARPLLFEPDKTIGFDVGQHTLDLYLLKPQDIQYYKARVPYTNLSLVTGGSTEQYFKAVLSENINPQLNIGGNFNVIGSHGFYLHQGVSDISGAAFAWYESKSKRYNLLANVIFNSLKTPENGSLITDPFYSGTGSSFDRSQDPTKLVNSANNWRTTSIYLKNFYYIGKIDTNKRGADGSAILPTQRVQYTFYYNAGRYQFLQNEPDTYNAFPDYYFSANRSKDSLVVNHLQNDFSYSFYLRGHSKGTTKNEAKLDLGITQDLYQYSQFVADTAFNNLFGKAIQQDKKESGSFQDIAVKGKISYRFSDRIILNGSVQQIVAGRDFGNFLYDGKLTLSGGQKAGKVIFEGYSQNSSPPLIYTNWVSNHFIFHNDFSNQKTNSASFSYINDPLQLTIKAEYFLISNYLYFTAQTNGIDATPAQLSSDINLLKVSVGKNLTFWRRWHFDNFVTYQKTDYQAVLRTPEFYSYSSLHRTQTLFQILHTDIGVNVRFNTAYPSVSYAPGLGEFYNSNPAVTYSSYPVAAVFFKGTLLRTNLLVEYDYANQGAFSPAYYMVNRYPGPNHLLKLGVSWTFYN